MAVERTNTISRIGRIPSTTAPTYCQPKSAEAVHLATSHRLLRAQHFNSPHSYAHFSSFVLCSAGRDCGDLALELAALMGIPGGDAPAFETVMACGCALWNSGPTIYAMTSVLGDEIS